MQLLQVVLYHDDGRTKSLDFRPGALNVVVGNKRTGKSALLDIVDYCVGRDDAAVFPGIFGRVVPWVGTLWQLEDGNRAYVARPRAAHGKSSSTQAMLLFGGADMEPIPFEELTVNVGSSQLRARLGAAIGLSDVTVEQSDPDKAPFAVTLGTASVFSFQNQNEVASKSHLLHRSGDSLLMGRVRDALPFFLGAVDGDQPQRNADLRVARRVLTRLTSELQDARNDAEHIDADLRSLLREAHTVGLVDVGEVESRTLLLQFLENARSASVADTVVASTDTQDRVHALTEDRQRLRRELNAALADRHLLLDATSGATGYESAITQQAGRLRSLNLLGAEQTQNVCPVCQRDLTGADPLAEQLRTRLTTLSTDIQSMIVATPGRQRALSDSAERITSIREQLVSIEESLTAADVADPTGGQNLGDQHTRDFIRGRIDATIRGRRPLNDEALDELQAAVVEAAARVTVLEQGTSTDEAEELIASKVGIVSADVTYYAQQQKVEYATRSVRFEPKKLTVVADTTDGPKTLQQMGSGANWVGYHVAAHLALHRYFVLNDRPLPRLLMLDQPSQPFYEGSNSSAKSTDQEDVRRMFTLLRDFVDELTPRFQIILSEHATLDDDWFQALPTHTLWTEGLVPRDWADDETWEEFTTQPESAEDDDPADGIDVGAESEPPPTEDDLSRE